jgi:predicted permease
MSVRHDPPRWAERLLRRMAPAAEATVVADDLAEEFRSRADTGLRAAQRWYWRQVIGSVPALLGWRLRNALQVPTSRQGDSMFRQFADDVRSAIRASVRTPLTTVVIVVTMVLGVGATTAVFSVTNAVLLRPLPFDHSERVVEFSATLRDGRSFPELAYPDLQDFRRDLKDFATLSVYTERDMTLQRQDEPRLIHAVQVDGDYARVFGLHPMLGRLPNRDDAQPGHDRVAVVSYAMWQRNLGGSADIVGKSITLDNESYQLIGVLAPSAYTYPVMSADVLTPLAVDPAGGANRRGNMWARAAAVLQPGATMAHARQELDIATTHLAQQFPDANTGVRARIERLDVVVVGGVRSMLLLLSLTVAAVLLVACVNVANLLLTRAEARAREFAVRAAIGGSPARLRHQLSVETLLLAVIGGGFGLALVPLLIHALVATYPDALPRASEIVIDVRVLAIAVVAMVGAGLLSGVPATRRLTRVDLTRDLRQRSAGSSTRTGRQVSRILVIGQVAMSLALLVAAGLLLQTLRRLDRADPGFTPAGALSFRVYASQSRHPTAIAVQQFYQGLLDSLQHIPGVQAAGASTRIPFANEGAFDVWIQDELGDQGPGKNPSGAIAIATPGLERALGLRLVQGRFFTPTDDSAAVSVAILDDVGARKLYPRGDAVGHFIRFGYGRQQIVGVVHATPQSNFWDEPIPTLYLPETQVAKRAAFVVIRATASPAVVLSAARRIVHAVDPTIALTDIETMDERIGASLAGQRFRAGLVGGLSLVALVLAVIGLYGVIAYSVTQRRHEIGVRIALGERTGAVRRRVVGEALGIAAIGIAMGSLLALAAGRVLAAFLVGVSAHDPVIFGGAALIMMVIIVLAADGPARRAARVDPLVAMRGDG